MATHTMRIRRRMLQNYLLIWVDENIDTENEECQNACTRMQRIVKQVNICSTAAQCIEILNDLNDGKAFVISSAVLGQDLVSAIHDMKCVDAIYIFCGNKTSCEKWTQQWKKIRGVFTSVKAICESLKNVAHECDHDSIPMSFVPKSKTGRETSDQEDLNQLPSAFMYSVLFKEIILEINDDDTKSISDLIAYCRKKNITEDELKNFQREYQLKSPVWLYTCELFLYSMLNRALWSLDMEAMIKMGFFIRKLHHQLEHLHEEQSDLFRESFIVYRGQGFAQLEFQQLTETKGGLLSFNNFLSTSKAKTVAMAFVHGALANKDNVAVLFTMRIDPSKVPVSTTSYALIDKHSAIPQEQEILFSMHSVFRVEDVQQATYNSRVWEVQLTFTDDNDLQLTNLTHRMREELSGSNGWHRMGDLMITVGHFDQAEELYNQLLENSSDDSDQAAIYHQLGRIKGQQGQYKDEISFYEKSLRIVQKSLPADHPSLANSYNSIATTYYKMGDYSIALEFYEKALNINERVLVPNHPDLATSYSNIGLVYTNMGDYSKALKFYEKDLEITKKVLPSNHPDLATSYSNMALIYNSMGDYSRALEFYCKDLEITKKALPPNHPSLATSYNNVGNTYANKGDYSKALPLLEKALEILQKTLPSTHPHIKVTNDSIEYIKTKL